jgi:Integrase core domain
VIEARRRIGGWLCFYNEERPHQALGYRTPRTVFAGAACEYHSYNIRKESIDVLLSKVLMYCSV